MTRLQELRKQRAALRREMRERGIRRTSFMNGGLTPDESRFNFDMFAIETAIKRETISATPKTEI